MCKIVKNQLALPDDSDVTGESKFAALGADSLDTVIINIMQTFNMLLLRVNYISSRLLDLLFVSKITAISLCYKIIRKFI